MYSKNWFGRRKESKIYSNGMVGRVFEFEDASGNRIGERLTLNKLFGI